MDCNLLNLNKQIIELCELKGEQLKRANDIIDSFANRGLRSLAVAHQVSITGKYYNI